MLLVRHDGSFDIPKGTLRYGETLEACALREVEEESGQRTEVTGYLGSRLDDGIDEKGGARISKTTHYFALKWVADTGIHDAEYDHIEWIGTEEAQNKLKTSSAEIVGRFLEFARLFPKEL
jgi:8-oxo-dGTP pyrophosphatase MutT (NUDIX family)